MIKKIYGHFMHDHLYRSSIYVMASTFITGVLGFVFWLIVARTFKTQFAGIAATLISVQSLISLFSALGLNQSLIRYLPKSTQRNDIINSSFVVTAVSSAILAFVFLLGLR